ncbi:protein of unknown function [Cardinium endosymbiont cEper1 of Encarsia pergandiella]|uniref:hypothetical protein n=1 Tax=Cardinium endosymbiont of Encarsia pergandiella TaxID=249402 RepID=UPI00027EA78B|nr:hypothetical protein [Cardinium endosymbiont of Encarsia pergandiella]CCM09791.1 protein of unknown function [Cardinium endosymbiont cEper1 of Encarsia pergandiella]
MASKYNIYKSITQGLVGPNILFPAVYLLFSAEICTSSPKDKPRNGIGNEYVATLQVKQTNKIAEISNPKGEANDFSQLHEVQDDLAIDSAQDDESFDTDTTTPSVEPSEDSVAKDESKASVVDTTSKQDQQQESIKGDPCIPSSDENSGLSTALHNAVFKRSPAFRGSDAESDAESDSECVDNQLGDESDDNPDDEHDKYINQEKNNYKALKRYTNNKPQNINLRAFAEGFDNRSENDKKVDGQDEQKYDNDENTDTDTDTDTEWDD